METKKGKGYKCDNCGKFYPLSKIKAQCPECQCTLCNKCFKEHEKESFDEEECPFCEPPKLNILN